MRNMQGMLLGLLIGVAVPAIPQECCVTITYSEISHTGCGRSMDLKNSSKDRSATATIQRTTNTKNHPPDTDLHDQNIGPGVRVFIGCASYSDYKGPMVDATATYKITKVEWKPAGQ